MTEVVAAATPGPSLQASRQEADDMGQAPFTGERMLRRGALTGVFVGLVLAAAPSTELVQIFVACIAGYAMVSVLVDRICDGQRVSLEGSEYPAWSFYMAFLHNGVITLMLAVAIAFLRWGQLDLNTWFRSSWGELTPRGDVPLAERLEALLFCAIMGCEVKDAILLDVQLNAFDLGLVVHHLATVIGCLFCLRLPLGKGVVVLNAVNANLGSAVFNFATMIPLMWPTSRKRLQAARVAYWFGMTVSNVAGALLAMEFDRVTADEIETTSKRVYTVLTAILVVLRQLPVLKMMWDDFSGHIKTV